MPKRGCDVSTCEISRFYRYQGYLKSTILHFKVPQSIESPKIVVYGRIYVGLILTPFQVEQQWIRAGHPFQSAPKVRALPGGLQ